MIESVRKLVTTDNSEIATDPTSAELAVVLEMLCNERRRLILEYLAGVDVGEQVRLTDLVEFVNSEQSDSDVINTVDRTHTALYQIHCPRLDEAGVLEFSGLEVTKTAETERMIGVLQELQCLTGGDR